MTFLDLIKPEAVKVISGASSKKRVIQALSELAGGAYGLNNQAVLEALMEREALGPTGVGNGVALPHARLTGAEKVSGAFLLLEKPIEFEAVDRQPVDLVFALFAPEQAGVEHLKALALVSRSLRVSNLCSKLRANPDAMTLHTILTEPESQAA